MQKKYVLSASDGYSIESTPYNTLQEAQEAMQKAYKELTPSDNDESSQEMSGIGKMDAILYANGEYCYVWDITEVPFEPERTLGLTQERAMELLNQIVNHVSSAENTRNTIRILVDMGFQTDELANHFDFSESEIDNYEHDFEEELEESF